MGLQLNACINQQRQKRQMGVKTRTRLASQQAVDKDAHCNGDLNLLQSVKYTQSMKLVFVAKVLAAGTKIIKELISSSLQPTVISVAWTS